MKISNCWGELSKVKKVTMERYKKRSIYEWTKKNSVGYDNDKYNSKSLLWQYNSTAEVLNCSFLGYIISNGKTTVMKNQEEYGRYQLGDILTCNMIIDCKTEKISASIGTL